MNFLIFDIDGTLADTKEVEDKCFTKAFKDTFNIDITNERWENFQDVTDWGITEEIINREWNRKPRKDEIQLMISNFVGMLKIERAKDINQFQEVKGARVIFNELRNDNQFKLGIATGAWEASAKMKLETIGIDLDGICFSNSNHHKSRESITQDVVNQLKINSKDTPERIIYFGDGEWDLKTCQNLNIEFIGIDINNDGKLKKLGAEAVFRNYLDKEIIISEIKKW